MNRTNLTLAVQLAKLQSADKLHLSTVEAIRAADPGAGPICDELAKPHNVERIVTQTAEVLAEMMTEKELKALIEFYSTDVGQSCNQKMPDVMAECSRRSQALGQEIVMDALANGTIH